MSFGYSRQLRVYINNTALLNAELYEDDRESLVPLTDINSVLFTVKKPSDPTSTPTIASATGNIVDDGLGQYLVPAGVIVEPGDYLAYAMFTRTDGQVTTVECNFDAVDPFEATDISPADVSIDQAWRKFEDCFDSELGGPWLRDMTMARFDKSRMRSLIPEVLLQINTWQPVTAFDESTYPYLDPSAGPLFAQGLLCSSIRHLIRSYTEQPDVNNSPVGFLDRKRYADAWRATYEIENESFKEWLKLYKRTMLQLGHAKLLVANKAGRLQSAPMRSRGAFRGYY